MRKVVLTLAVVVLCLSLFAGKALAQEFKFWAEYATYVNWYNEDPDWADRNYNDWDQLRVRDAYTSPSGYDYRSRTFLRFSDSDLASLNGYEIVSASLHLYETERLPNTSNGGDIELFRVTQDWDASTVTWNNQPEHAGSRITARMFDESDVTPGWRAWYGLANLVRWWVSGEQLNQGIVLLNDENEVFNEMNSIFAKLMDQGYYPYLKITVVPEPLSATLFILGGGVLGLSVVRRKKVKS